MNSQLGHSENIRVGNAKDALPGWSTTNIRKAMGRASSASSWLPTSNNLLVFCREAKVSADWLFFCRDAAQPEIETLERLVLEALAKTPFGKRVVKIGKLQVDGGALLRHIVAMTEQYLSDIDERVEFVKPLRRLEALAGRADKDRAAALSAEISQLLEWTSAPAQMVIAPAQYLLLGEPKIFALTTHEGQRKRGA